mgnify:CR=1 FL=1
MTYKPNPVDLSEIKLNAELSEDVEKISCHIHEVWAKNRIENGWGYDKVDESHPCLIKYEDLPETEKDLDRATVTQTIKMLLYLGYEIKKGNENDV